MRICLCFHVLFLRFYRENRGEGERVMDLVYGSSSSLDMNCEVNFVCCYADSPISGSFNLVELTSESGMSQALVIPDRYPAVPSVSR